MPEDPKNQLESHADLEFVNNLKTAADVLLRIRMSGYISDGHRRRDILSESEDSYESSDSDSAETNSNNHGNSSDQSVQLNAMPLPPQSPPQSSDHPHNHTNAQTTPLQQSPMPQTSNNVTPEEVQEHIVRNYAYAYADAALALAHSLGISIEDAQMILSDNN